MILGEKRRAHDNGKHNKPEEIIKEGYQKKRKNFQGNTTNRVLNDYNLLEVEDIGSSTKMVRRVTESSVTKTQLGGVAVASDQPHYSL